MKKLESNLPATPEFYRASAPPPIIDAEFEPQPANVPLAHYLWILRRHGWKIAGFVVAIVLATLIVSLRLTPIYESTTTVDVDRQMPTGVIGQDAREAVSNDADQFLATQMKLIQSDSVVRPVVDKLRLREVEKDALEEAIDKSATSLDAPVILKHLSVTRPPNTYILLISYRSPNRQLAADVANSIAQSYLAHIYRIRYKATEGLGQFMERQLEELKAQMERSSSALVQFERELNVINPEEKTSILSSRLLQLNTEYTNAQADRVKKEAAFNSVKDGTLAAAQVSNQGEALKKLTEAFDEAQEHFAEVKNHYGINHPEYKKAESKVQELAKEIAETRSSIAQRVEIEYHEAVNREAMLETAVKETKAEFDRLNARSFEYQTLKREADSDKGLYEELVRKIKEAGINASFQNSSVRVADEARPGLRPVFPRILLNAVLAFLFATLFAVGAAVLSDVLDNTIRDPDQVARLLNTVVIGSLPAVKDWRRRLSPIQTNHAGHGGLLPNGNGHANEAYANGNGAHANGVAGALAIVPGEAILGTNGLDTNGAGENGVGENGSGTNGVAKNAGAKNGAKNAGVSNGSRNGGNSTGLPAPANAPGGLDGTSGLSSLTTGTSRLGSLATGSSKRGPSGHSSARNSSNEHDGDYQALSTYEEAIRTLRNSILLTDFDRRLRSVLMTSASPSEGKSTVAAHLAATHAGQHKRTLLIDGDLRRPSVHRLFQVPNSVGLSNVLLQQISWRDAVIRLDEPNGLDILPAGPSTRRASDLIGMGIAELIEEATREYDLVVLDAPPLLGFAEPLQMATAVDGVIIVARAGDTSRKALSSVISTLDRLRANLIGVVLNEVHRQVSAGYYYYYGHYNKYYNRPDVS